MKNNFLRQFYQGNIEPWNLVLQEPAHIRQETRLLLIADQLTELLRGTDRGLKYLEEYRALVDAVTRDVQEETFLSGFRLGAQLMLDVFSGEEFISD